MYWLSSAHHQASIASLSNSSHGNIIYNTWSATGDHFFSNNRGARSGSTNCLKSLCLSLVVHPPPPTQSLLSVRPLPSPPVHSPTNCHAITLNFILFHQQQFFYSPPPPPPVTTDKSRLFCIKCSARARLLLIEMKMQWMIQVVFSKCCCQI